MTLGAPKRLLAFAACTAVVIAACATDRDGTPIVLGESQHDTHDHGTTAKVSQDLSATQFFGTSLPAKTLALTFDDGPGPRTKELSIYLKSQNIKAAFFMNGRRLANSALPNPNGIAVVADPAGTLAQVLADGHLVANHTTTHRDITTVSAGDRILELSETDTDIAAYVSPQNHLLFRAPFGSYNNTVFTTLSASAMNKYIGPIYWEAGGFDSGFPSRAADWACWQGVMRDGAGALINVGNDPGYATTTQCGDAYFAEIETTYPKGIVLMHDPYSWTKGAASGSTVDMVKYLVPKLVAAGYSFVRVDEVPAIKAALPPPICDASCATCSGPAANQCTACLGDRYKSGGQCLLCATCTASQYVSAACTATTNTACSACTVCGSGKYPSAACTATADTTCGACDASCTACSGPNANQCGTCPSGFYLGGGSCNACAAGTFASSGATSCSPCPAGAFSGPGAGACTSCGSCDDGNACTNDQCDAVKGCGHEAIAGCAPSSSSNVSLDAGDADAADPAASSEANGCSVGISRGSSGSGGNRGILALAAASLSLLARRRKHEAR